jgi:hypothetical protein
MKDIRYGVYLRPDAATCWAVTQITLALRKQFGLVSAAAFPPHATLIGNLATDISEDELVARLDPVLSSIRPFRIYNSGIVRTPKDTFEYNVDLDENAHEPNDALRTLAKIVAETVIPIALRKADTLTVPVEDYEFAGHIGLGSHDLALATRLSDEVGEFLAGLPISAPTSFETRFFTLFEFTADWSAHWWEHLEWRHIRSWEAHHPAVNPVPVKVII